MNRRQFIGVAAGVGVSFSGCLGQGSPPTRPTDSSDQTTTPGVESQVDVPPCPERPATFTADTVLDFAIQFEKAYLTRRTLEEHERIVSIDVDIGGQLVKKSSTRTTDGWIVRFSVLGPAYRYRPTPGSTRTRHVDPALFVANYFITDATVLRAAATEAVDPQEVGEVVQCPPQ